ncbi:MAG TPA: Gx transporter family protein, partial [Clostridiales bacterium]|nr:Gx transporter family protein [Clostridiales bacterium]
LSAAAFNILQLAAAVYVTGTDFFAAYLPFMLFASVVSGLITGIALNLSAPAIEKYASLNRLFI